MLLTYTVPGISCEHCKTSIEGELDQLPGVAWSDVDVEAQTVVVQGDVDDEVVKAAIADVGYSEVFLVSAEADAEAEPLADDASASEPGGDGARAERAGAQPPGSEQDGGEGLGVDDGEPLGGAGEGDVEGA